MVKNKGIPAKKFYSSIRNKSDYKLVNGLFIVKYVGKGIYKYVGEFAKKGSLRATPKTSYVKVLKSKQLFHPGQKKTTTYLGNWTRLRIGFRKKPISSILA